MRSLSDLTGGTLAWVQRSRRTFDLKRHEETFATLEWPSAFGSLGTGQTAEAAFTFKRVGFLRPSVTVRRPGSESNLATLRMGFGGGGSLEFADGRRYEFRHRGFWNPEWTISDGNGRSLGRITMTAQLLRREGEVTLDVDPRDQPDLPLLTLLGWYVILLQIGEAAAASAGTAGVIPAAG